MMQKKDAFYFPHDSNAKDDPKCIMLIEQLGLEGYGIYWVLIETLRDQPGYKYPLKLIPALARRFNTTSEKMNIVVQGYELFEIDEKDFFSLSLMQRMQRLDAKREQAREAGRISAAKRAGLPIPTDVQQTFNGCSTDVQPKRVYNIKEEILNNKIHTDFFESVWHLYPNKKGKGQVKTTQIKKLEKIGYEELAKCVERYKSTKPDWQQWQNGSTFFNSGYLDYLDANYQEIKTQSQQMDDYLDELCEQSKKEAEENETR